MAGLRAWANSARHETAGAHVEDALLTRFRELGRAKETEPDIQSPKRALWKTPVYVGLAASVLLLLGWALMQFTRETGSGAGSTSARTETLHKFRGKGCCP